MNRKRVGLFFACVIAMLVVLLLFVEKKNTQEETIVASNFFAYDIARALTKDTTLKVEMLIPAGQDLHHFEPSVNDMISLEETKLILMNGGESEEWLNEIVEKYDNSKIYKMIDTQGIKYLNEHKSAEIDEHIWTSPKNAAIILRAVKEKITELYPNESNKVEKNFTSYEAELYQLDTDFTTLIKNAPRRQLILADRNSMAYFFNEYGIDYLTAFPGCAEQTEPSPTKIAELSNKIKSSNTQIIFQTEFENSKIAKELNAKKVLTLQSLHTVTKSNFDEGKTYIDLMQENYYNLREFYYAD